MEMARWDSVEMARYAFGTALFFWAGAAGGKSVYLSRSMPIVPLALAPRVTRTVRLPLPSAAGGARGVRQCRDWAPHDLRSGQVVYIKTR